MHIIGPRDSAPTETEWPPFRDLPVTFRRFGPSAATCRGG
ncbi:hypothetical protein I546_5850 [Mycobacterium kansasii 732]|nr:hypothetical protein I546_5850 [Mycobacterium kansasii 732]